MSAARPVVMLILVGGTLGVAVRGAWTQEIRADGSAHSNGRGTREASYSVVIRIAEELLQDSDPSPVERVSDVRLTVLGTPVCGTARTQATLSIDLVDDSYDAAAYIECRGTTISDTVGRKGPATVSSRVYSEFVARKPLIFDLDEGFQTGDAQLKTRTRTVRRTVQTSAPGLRGRIVRRIAWGQIQDQQPILHAIADQNARQRIRSQFEGETETRLARLNRRFKLATSLLAANRVRNAGLDVELYTRGNYLEICMGPGGIDVAPDLPLDSVPRHPLQVWLHSSTIHTGAPELLAQWAVLRSMLLPRMAAPEMEVKLPRREIPLLLSTASPWVVIGAGELPENSR